MQIFKKTLFPCKIEVLGVVTIKIKYLLRSMAGCYHFPMILAEQIKLLQYEAIKNSFHNWQINTSNNGIKKISLLGHNQEGELCGKFIGLQKLVFLQNAKFQEEMTAHLYCNMEFNRSQKHYF